MARSPSTPSGNRTLASAKAAKQDEFYTQLADIENGLRLHGKRFLIIGSKNRQLRHGQPRHYSL